MSWVILGAVHGMLAWVLLLQRRMTHDIPSARATQLVTAASTIGHDGSPLDGLGSSAILWPARGKRRASIAYQKK